MCCIVVAEWLNCLRGGGTELFLPVCRIPSWPFICNKVRGVADGDNVRGDSNDTDR